MSASSSRTNVLGFVSQCRERLHCVTSLAKEALAYSMDSMNSSIIPEKLHRGDERLAALCDSQQCVVDNPSFSLV